MCAVRYTIYGIATVRQTSGSGLSKELQCGPRLRIIRRKVIRRQDRLCKCIANILILSIFYTSLLFSLRIHYFIRGELIMQSPQFILTLVSFSPFGFSSLSNLAYSYWFFFFFLWDYSLRYNLYSISFSTFYFCQRIAYSNENVSISTEYLTYLNQRRPTQTTNSDSARQRTNL